MSKILIDEAVVRQALEALENHSGNYKLNKAECVKYNAVEAALRKALEQPRSEAALAQQSAERGEPDGIRRKPLEERLKDAFYEGFTSVETYNDKSLNDVDEEWLKYAAAHGITKGN